MTAHSDLPQHSIVIVVGPAGISYWINPWETEPTLDTDQKLACNAKLQFPPVTRRDYVQQRCQALRHLLERSVAPDSEGARLTTAIAYAGVLGYCDLANKSNLRPAKWKFLAFAQDDPGDLRVLFVPADEEVANGDQVFPLVLIDDDFGLQMERTIEEALKRQERRGIRNFPFVHLMTAAFRTMRLERLRLDVEKAAKAAAAQPVPPLKIHVPLTAAI